MANSERGQVRTDSYEIGDFLLQEMTKGVPPWRPGFEQSFVRSFPHNAVTNRSYDGWFNVMVLMSTMRDLGTFDGGFLTEIQARKLGVTIDDEAIASAISYADGIRRFQKTYFVYNVTQTTGFERTTVSSHLWDPNTRVESTIKRSGARIMHDGDLNVPHYDFYEDQIFVPNRDRFFDSGSYYQVVLHELAHWTGHASRLNRELREACCSSEGRAREELRAEIASYLLGLEFGIGHDLRQNLAYLDYWKRFLVSDGEEMRDAVATAMKICKFLKQFDQLTRKHKNRHPTNSTTVACQRRWRPDDTELIKTTSDYSF